MKHLIVNGGRLKGHSIVCPPMAIRPVMSIVREAVFQILDNTLHLSHTPTSTQNTQSTPESLVSFLDLFSGSGLMAIEAVSRGFDFSVSVESDWRKWSIIHKNFNIDKNKLFLKKKSVELYLMRAHHEFNVIFVDPPFKYPHKQDLMMRIVKSKACGIHTIVLIHVPTREKLHDVYGSYKTKMIKTYGGSTVYIYTLNQGM